MTKFFTVLLFLCSLVPEADAAKRAVAQSQQQGPKPTHWMDYPDLVCKTVGSTYRLKYVALDNSYQIRLEKSPEVLESVIRDKDGVWLNEKTGTFLLELEAGAESEKIVVDNKEMILSVQTLEHECERAK
jgi:hypothetical protein